MMQKEYVVYYGSIECLVGTYDGKIVAYTGPFLRDFIYHPLKELTKAGYKLNPLVQSNHAKENPDQIQVQCKDGFAKRKGKKR